MESAYVYDFRGETDSDDEWKVNKPPERESEETDKFGSKMLSYIRRKKLKHQ